MMYALQVLSWVLIITGSIFVVIGGIGLLRLPDFYTRIHAAGITDTLGSWLIVAGLAVHEGFTLTTAKLIMLLLLMVLTSPLSSHALAKAAYVRGLDPLQGPDLVDRHEVDDRA